MIGGNSWDIENHHLYLIIDKFLKTGVPVAAICGAVDYLAQSGLLQGYKHTGNAQLPWLESENYHNKEDFIEQQAVKDHNLITANGTAPIEFTDLILQAVHFETEETRQKRFVYTNLDTMITIKSTETLSPKHSLQLDTLINVVTSNSNNDCLSHFYGIY